MRAFNRCSTGVVCFLSTLLVSSATAQAQRAATANLNLTANNDTAITETVESSTGGAGCDTINGTRFNLEPRLNPTLQNTESVAFLLNGASQGVDLIVGTGNDGTSSPSSRFGTDVHDAYYVHRQGATCNSDFEGALPFAGLGGLFPAVVADPARGNFFLADIALSTGATMQVARTTAATLLSPTACPNGTNKVGTNPICWPIGIIVAFTPPTEQSTLLFPHLAVDPRTSGTGGGDVYLVAEILDLQKQPAVDTIQIIACSNASLTCGTPVTVSGSDTFTSHPWIQVRPDGVITVSYSTFAKQPPAPSEIKFATCQPQGAPKPPVCLTPNLVATQNITFGSYAPAGDNFDVQLYPQHINRIESNGTFTTFLIYDRCNTILSPPFDSAAPVCATVDVVLGESTDGGTSWSTFQPVESALGHRFMGTISNDTSTGITNIAYYSTQNDPFLQRPQILLSQIPAGSTTPGPAIALTSNPTDLNVGVQDVVLSNGVINAGEKIGSASAGTGTTGQSKLYVHYTSNNVFGTFNGLQQPDQNNTLIEFSY